MYDPQKPKRKYKVEECAEAMQVMEFNNYYRNRWDFLLIREVKGWTENRALFYRNLSKFNWTILVIPQCKWTQNICKNVQYWKPSHAF